LYYVQYQYNLQYTSIMLGHLPYAHETAMQYWILLGFLNYIQ